MRGIPTTYAGINFRSRAEARWAAFFDQAGWPWQYEPLDICVTLEGESLIRYIPDFMLDFPAGPILVEVKGGETTRDSLHAEGGRKLWWAVWSEWHRLHGGEGEPGWPPPPCRTATGLMLGAAPIGLQEEWPAIGTMFWTDGADGHGHAARVAGRCEGRPLSIVGLHHDHGQAFNWCFACGEPDGTESGKGPHDFPCGDATRRIVNAAWAAACNATQWRPPKGRPVR